MQTPGTIKLVPLAPPASVTSVKKRPTQEDNRFNWPAWLSPKIVRPNRINRKHNERDYDSPTERRPRRASFDDPMGGSIRDDSMLIVPYHRANQACENVPRKRDINSSSNTEQSTFTDQCSLLTVFLLSLNELLPEYCNQLVNAADLGPSNSAVKAIQVLERGAIKLHKSSSSIKESHQSHSLAYSQENRDEPPHSPSFSPSQFLRQLSTGSGSQTKDMRISQAYDHLQHLVSPSPTRRQFCNSRGSDSTPKSAPSSPSYRGMSKTTANEWERFVNPFHMLVAAEILYGRMEHMVDPDSEADFVAKDLSDTKSKSSDTDVVSSHMSMLRLPFLDCLRDISSENSMEATAKSVRKSPLVTFNFASRQESPIRSSDKTFGSRSLTAIYQQVRDDLVIVGEYLCDPILGSHAVGRKQQSDKLPTLPYQDDESVVQLKPKISKSIDDASLENTDKTDTRHLAAVSLRDTLGNLISFIEARCVLINVHAEMASWGLSKNASNGSWNDLAERCEKIPITCRLMVKIEYETKALKMVLEVVNYLETFDFFRCTLSLRKLYVLLGSSPSHDVEYFLPVMWIRSSYVRILSLANVMFSEKALCGVKHEKKLPYMQSSNKKNLYKRDGSILTRPQMLNFDALTSEFLSSNGSDLPFALIVARKLDNNSWLPVYVKTSPYIKTEPYSESIWPYTLWHQIEKSLAMQFASNKQPFKYEIECIHDDSTMSNDGASLKEKKNKSNQTATMSTCYVATVTTTSSLVIVRGPESGKKRKISNDDISQFMSTSLEQLVPRNVFGINTILATKSMMMASAGAKKDSGQTSGIFPFENYSLWDRLEWSSKQQQLKILHVLGLRKSSPQTAPLKSPYINRKVLRQRRKKKSTMNHGHLSLFLGSELSQII